MEGGIYAAVGDIGGTNFRLRVIRIEGKHTTPVMDEVYVTKSEGSLSAPIL